MTAAKKPLLPVEAIGRPVALSAVTRLLLKIQQRPPVRLVQTPAANDPADQQEGRPVPAQQQGPV